MMNGDFARRHPEGHEDRGRGASASGQPVSASATGFNSVIAPSASVAITASPMLVNVVRSQSRCSVAVFNASVKESERFVSCFRSKKENPEANAITRATMLAFTHSKVRRERARRSSRSCCSRSGFGHVENSALR